MEKWSGSAVVAGILALKCYSEQLESWDVVGSSLVFFSNLQQASIVIQDQEFLQGNNSSFVFDVTANSRLRCTGLSQWPDKPRVWCNSDNLQATVSCLPRSQCPLFSNSCSTDHCRWPTEEPPFPCAICMVTSQAGPSLQPCCWRSKDWCEIPKASLYPAMSVCSYLCALFLLEVPKSNLTLLTLILLKPWYSYMCQMLW